MSVRHLRAGRARAADDRPAHEARAFPPAKWDILRRLADPRHHAAIGPAQLAAGVEVRELCRAAMDDGVPAMDPARVVVDGGPGKGGRLPPRLRREPARLQLEALHRHLGDEQFRVVVAVAAWNLPLAHVGVLIGLAHDGAGHIARADHDYVARLLRRGLAAAAAHLGKATTGRPADIVAMIAEGGRMEARR